MKISALAVVSLALALSFSASAHGQACYTPITSWQGTYTLNGTGSGSDQYGQYSWTIDHQATGTVNLALGSSSCTQASWTGADTFVGTVSDFGTNTCGDGSPDTESWTGGPSFLTGSVLQIDLGAGAFKYFEDPIVTAAETTNSCGSVSTGSLPIQIFPFDPSCTGTLVGGSASLPSTAQSLSGEVSLSGVAVCPYAIPATWSLEYDLIPVFQDDKDCKEQGGSTVGCRNQSLGEDVPIVGTNFTLHYEGDRAAGVGADPVANTDALMIGGWTLSAHHAYNPANHTLFLGDGSQRNGYQLGTAVTYMGNVLITSQQGDEVYVFSPTGQHLQTLRRLTGAPVYQFGYDSSNNLISVTDVNGNVTTVKRNAAGHATAIVSPYAQTTVLTLDKKFLLTQVKDPLGNLSSFTNTPAGLLIARTDANGNDYNYTYDNNGKLIKDADPVGGYHALARTNATSGFGWTVAHQTAMGTSSSYQSALTLPWVQSPTDGYSSQQTNILPTGLQTTSSTTLQNGNLTQSITLPNGIFESQTYGPDPIWGLQVPVVTSATLTQGNLTMNRTESRATTLASVGNPFSVATQTDTDTVNGRVYTTTFTGASRTYVYKSPVNRAVTVVLDTQERPVSTLVAGLTATTLAYTAKGQLLSTTQGTRKTSLTYNAKGFVSSVTDPLKQKTSLTFDADGHLLSTTLADARIIGQTYDADGNMLTVTPPGKSAHIFTYTGVDLPETYTAPGAPAMTFSYDLDRNLTSRVRPGGQTIGYAYDTANRLTTVTTPTAVNHYVFSTITGNIASAVRGTEHIAYAYNGPLLTKSTWTGTVAGNVSRVYNNNFWTTSQSVNGANPIAFHHDNDGLITSAGALTVKRNLNNGLITGTTLGIVTDARTYNTFGDLTGFTASVSGTVVYEYQATRNANAMISAKTETIGGVTNSYAYTYDVTGRLTGATKNSQADSYTYDTNSNRLTGTTASGTATGTYDAQDRLLTYGPVTYTYTAAGDLSSQKNGAQKTTYTYDALGNLTAAALPNGTKIAYIIDAENNRVGKSVNGIYTTGFLYDDDHIVAQLDGSNLLVSRFVYGTGSAVPTYMIRGSSTYRIVTNSLGSPVLVIDSGTGAIAEQITYDEFGNVLSDTNPGFQPFGFAGGLYDQDTKLVRFGARDYNPAVGRWTAKDPTLFSGGETNLYNYVQSDPVNHTDRSGLGDCEDKKEKAKKIAKKIVQKVTGNKVKVGPVNVSLDKPEISTGASVELKVNGTTVAEVDGEASAEITPSSNPADPLVNITVTVTVKIGNLEQKIVDLKTEVGKALTWRPWIDGFQKEFDRADQACHGTCMGDN